MMYLSNVSGNILLHQSDTCCHIAPTVLKGFPVWQQHYEKFKWLYRIQ
uniref:Uncharacterized protein n=1 Tax=Anopheles funestus TaxID=62324 RepID=A0A182S182_ANOFN